MSQSLIDLETQYLEMIGAILRRHLPADSTVWIFGSRVKGTARKFSDVDLAIDMSGKPLSIEIYADLATDFEESNLPYKVDIVDWNTISDDFRQLITQEKITLNIKGVEP